MAVRVSGLLHEVEEGNQFAFQHEPEVKYLLLTKQEHHYSVLRYGSKAEEDVNVAIPLDQYGDKPVFEWV